MRNLLHCHSNCKEKNSEKEKFTERYISTTLNHPSSSLHLLTRATLFFTHGKQLRAISRKAEKSIIHRMTKIGGILSKPSELDPWAKSHRYSTRTNEGERKNWIISTRRTNSRDLYHVPLWRRMKMKIGKKMIQTSRIAFAFFMCVDF